MTGHINLFRVYEFVARTPELVRKGRFGGYGILVKNLVDPIPESAGWYLWGRFNDVGWWETIYLGKTGKKKTSSLRARIKEELLDERMAFWATLFGIEPTIRQIKKISANYGAEVTRALRKRNSHFIVWRESQTAEADISTNERFLISAFRPAINIQRKTLHNPPSTIADIIDAIEGEIDVIAGPNRPR